MSQQGDPGGKSSCDVLVVDDEIALLRAYSTLLRAAGHSVETADDGQAAKELLQQRSFDVILSDINMPGMDGIALLRAVREFDLDVPVVLITGTPSVETAAHAVRYGAFRYLTKPVEPAELRQVVDEAAALHRLARLKREMLSLAGVNDKQLGDRASLELAFERALSRLWIAFQPIVRCSDRSIFGYEALLRSNEPALPHPSALFDAAERLNRVHELGRAARACVARQLGQAPPDAAIFVNVHALELADESMYSEAEPLTVAAARVVLEVTERSNFDAVPAVPERVARLRKLGFRVAMDDLGAGYAGLTAFAQLVPEIVKIDMSLVRNVHRDPVRQRLIRAVVEASTSLKMLTVAEGVETAEERDT
ncbi:MAG TPA: EAL domain-containing protein, partial [Polyangiaceae bacterium]|nr:EAL domain-containing protein [Polyangiaceae bacterium]